MGFAGQVFAARVAIGLAVPSPKALSKTGSLLAQGVKAIHKRVRMAGKEAALDDTYRKRLTQLNQATRGSIMKTSNYVTAKLEQNLDRMSTRTLKNSRDLFKRTSKEYQYFQREINKPFKDRNLGQVAHNTKGMMSMQQMAINMSRMNAAERKEQIRHQHGVLMNANRQVNKQKEHVRLLAAQGKIKNEEFQKQMKIIGNLERVVRTEKRRLSILKQIDNELKEINLDLQQMDMEGMDMGAAFTEAGNTLRQNFNEALRNSVALLAGVGFQFHRATSAIMEFERELINANSVFNLTHDNLFSVGNEIIKFGNQYGITVANGAEGLYQLASAGVTANEALSILPETLKLSMAVQGDHNTISKLTAQTLFGFDMAMSQAGEVTDKFAFAIQKSLIEYQDLASAVKFALPFFTSTGQSIDQLLGALAILTNRALEAGIAGRGLRQAVAEFAESALDAEVGFRKMGVEILNAEGEMKQLTEIAADFAAAVGPDTASNTELLTTLIEDLNVRGATAFIHLVQASDEFTKAVEETAGAGGQLDAMIEEQNKSLSAQVQILKTNILSIFAFRDASYEGTRFINGFHKAIVESVETFKDLIIETDGAQQQLTETGKAIQEFGIDMIEVFVELGHQMIEIIEGLAESNIDWKQTLQLLAAPLKILLDFVDKIPPGMLEMYLQFKMINSIIPVTTALTVGLGNAFKYYGMMQLLSNPLMTAGMSKGGVGAAMSAARWGMIGSLALPVVAGLGAYALYSSFANEKAAGGYVSPMATGGFPRRTQPYLVGEQGPELFIPDTSGKILNTMQTQDNINNGSSVMKNVSIGIDSFGGLV